MLREVSRRIAGTTDSEWIRALLMAQLGDRAARPGAEDLVEATIGVLRILRGVRARHRIETSSPVNLFMATGESLVAQAQRELLSRAETLERP